MPVQQTRPPQQRLRRRVLEPFRDDRSMAVTAISRICPAVAKCTCQYTSRVPSSASETCTSRVSFCLFCEHGYCGLPGKIEGDGEISFCGAIEMAGIITVNCKVIKGGQKQMGMVNGRSPIYIPGPVQPQFGPGRMLYFEVILCLNNLVY